MVGLWDLCEAGDAAGLAKHVEWDGATIVYYQHPLGEGQRKVNRSHGPRQVILKSAATISRTGGGWSPADTAWFERMPTGDLVLPTLVFLQRQINEHLEPESAPQLLWNPSTGTLNLSSMPASLLGMLWLQFAGAVSGKITYHQCPSCQKWVRIGQEAARTNRRYCSNACRTQGLRARQARARELHGAGRPIESIAGELGSDIATVTRWVTAST
jgi:hypothetical protein